MSEIEISDKFYPIVCSNEQKKKYFQFVSLSLISFLSGLKKTIKFWILDLKIRTYDLLFIDRKIPFLI